MKDVKFAFDINLGIYQSFGFSLLELVRFVVSLLEHLFR
jgi:hypothetical protein